MKIALATIHCRAGFIPLSLLYLKACLIEQQPFTPDDIPILEFPPDVDADRVASAILTTVPDLVGFSCYVWNITTLMEVARALKEARPQLRIVIGGPEVGPLGNEVLERYSAVDVVVHSEGEGPFPQVVERYQVGLGLEDVPGISYRDGARIVSTEEAPILRDLNVLPSPHLGGYIDPTAARIVCIETQRGCVFKCNFCFYNKDLSIRNRRFDLDRVKQEILYWLQREVAEIYLMDPVFNLNAARAKEICRFIAEHNHRGIAFHAEIWAEFVDDEMARAFKDANMVFLEVGLQSTDDSALATVERRLRVERFVEGIRHLKRYSLPFELQLIFGLPGETRTSFRNSLNFAAALEPPQLAVFPLMVLPGTELWRKADALRMQYDSTPPYFVRSHLTMNSDDVAYGVEVSRAVARLNRLRSVELLCREPEVTLADVVDDWIEWAGGHAEEDDRALPGFIDYVCAKHRVPGEFYRQFVEAEVRLQPDATRAL